MKSGKSFAIFCNTNYVKDLLEIALKKKIIDDNTLILIHNVEPSKFFTNYLNLSEEILLKNIKIIYCFDFGINGDSVDFLYNTITKLNSKIIIEDQTAFPKKRNINSVQYRNLTYSLDENTVIPSHFANDAYIEELKILAKSFNRNITHMDICAGQGSIGLSLFNESTNIEKLYLVDINPNELNEVQKTIIQNRLTSNKINIVQSDVLDSFPKYEIIDLVSCNPPHVNRKAKSLLEKQGADEEWNFHRKFFRQIVEHMSEESIVTLIEYKGGSTKELIESILGDNLVIFKVVEINNTPWYILFIKKQKNENKIR